MRLARVTIVVPGYGAAIDYYCNTLGFGLVEDTRLSDSKRWVVVSPGLGGARRATRPMAVSRSCATLSAMTGT
jgi:catechol 2,3-dioxygenase-like lactoylglutathione lyase family enzyme